MKSKSTQNPSSEVNSKKQETQKQHLKNVETQCDPLAQAKSTFQQLLDIHSHRNFRKSLFVLISIHLLTFFTPFTQFVLDLPANIQMIFQETFEIWPFPTYSVTNENQVHMINLVFKGLEISVMLLYTIDLLPKIFIWKKPLTWKILNVLVVTLMVVQVPLTMRQYQLHAFSTDHLKIRICSIGLSFLLLCEIMSIREQKSMKSKKIQETIQKIKQSQNVSEVSQKQQNEKISSSYKVYTWPEIIKHDRREDCWVVIDGKVYDVTSLLPHHPGGDMILDGAGGECTFMWQSYHPSWMIEKKVQEKYLIGEVKDYESFYSYSDNFYMNLKKKIEEKVPRSKRQNDWKLFVKAAFIMIMYFYSIYMYFTRCDLISTLMFGFFAAQVGVNIMHDGNHAAFSSNKYITLLAGYTLDLVFSSSVIYRRSHNYGHHGCVNHYELDRAFDTTFPLLRLHRMQERAPMHKYQKYYVWLVYGLANFGDLFGTFDEMYWMSNYPTRQGHCPKKQIILQSIVKIIWYMSTIVFTSFKFGYLHAFPYWFLYMVAQSYGYTFFFAVNHWTDESAFIDNNSISNTNWGILQIENSSNFALDSPFWTHLSGGLNFQIEHHLVPGYSHTRLPEISQIVQDYCKEHKVRYFSYKTFWDALVGHYNLLKQLGEED
ncbi:cytochrome b5-like heme/steroid-binding domain protein (macronuclear) [Tetrahymena thermophila SB210]|uniref:Cytochrome b5-like heme/steroid-binding domain protein n=1 Tax=Tetrahymena thermophila (strain SB210) TaxID=312017 RepID=Q23K21_TETTS|nr:cytochrome b5-like heme/steroid-binding domain protein [Tetrahymena thermophila SB210]EAR97022.2 cytochrome b5-like heme/steroid-binding domain protein [Tetrahymena thermophila SB210]|eukprot:XP_001017267.2 cytochrome b5-like heme/steroid-binding domain protein [Tetrahymena thermophila SB210]